MSKIESNYPHFGSALILIGGILSIVFSVVRMIFMLLVGRAMRQWIARPMVWEKLGGSALVMGHMARLIFGFVMLGAVVSVVLGIIAIYGYTRVKSGKIQNGGLIAIIAGIVMLASTHWVMGIITLVGGILCYTWRPEAMSSQPQV